jgi:hypothetical protein
LGAGVAAGLGVGVGAGVGVGVFGTGTGTVTTGIGSGPVGTGFFRVGCSSVIVVQARIVTEMRLGAIERSRISTPTS